MQAWVGPYPEISMMQIFVGVFLHPSFAYFCACFFPISICMNEKASPSSKFFFAPLLEADSHVLVSSSLSASPSSSSEGWMFDSLEEIPSLSMIFTRSLTLSSSELVDVDLDAASSLTLIVSEVSSNSLAVVPLWAHPPSSPCDLDWEDEALLEDDDPLQYICYFSFSSTSTCMCVWLCFPCLLYLFVPS